MPDIDLQACGKPEFNHRDTPKIRALFLNELRRRVDSLQCPDDAPAPVDDGSDTSLYRFGAFWVDPPRSNETMMLHTFTERVTLGANFAGARGEIGRAPVETMTFEVWLNPWFEDTTIMGGELVGYMVVSSGGLYSFASAGGAAVIAEPGERIGVKAPEAADTQAVGGSFTFRATVVEEG